LKNGSTNSILRILFLRTALFGSSGTSFVNLLGKPLVIIDVRGRPYSQHRPAYMRAKQEFAQSPNRPLGNPKKFWEEFGKSVGAKIVIEKWVEDLPKVIGIEFNTEADYVWFMLRYS
jgi:hypothetical protein